MILLTGSLFMASCQQKPADILQQTEDRLNRMQSVEYETTIHTFQREMGTDKLDSALCYFDFTSHDSILGARYRFMTGNGEQVFNGHQFFQSNPFDETVIYSNQRVAFDVNSSTYLINSVYVLRKLLPQMMDAPDIKITWQNDRTIRKQECWVVSIDMKNKWIDPNANHQLKPAPGKTYHYMLAISKRMGLPVQFRWNYPDNKGYWESTFRYLGIDQGMETSAWSYGRFPKSYLRMSKQEYFASLKNRAQVKSGQVAPLWKLPALKGGFVSLKEIKGKLVLLEFWFPYCQGDEEATAFLNKLHKLDGHNDLAIYGIEMTGREASNLKTYVEKQKRLYPTLYQGRSVATEYGVDVAPAFFLIDGTGKVVYVSGLNKAALTNAIKTTMERR
jgi:peroxiredoxin